MRSDDIHTSRIKPCGLLIDPPVGPYSTKDEIERWIYDLRKMDLNCQEVQLCIEEAQNWINFKDEREH